MKRAPMSLWGLVLGALTLLFSAGFRPYLSTSDVNGERLSHEQGLALLATLSPPALSARAAILYDVDAGQILYELNAHQRLAPASTAKIATALITLKHAGLQQRITVGAEVEVAGTRVGLTPGDVATVEKLLYALLLNSGNDAAAALAVGIGGTEDQFVLWMNQLAAGLGLQDTHFVNPHGLDAPDQYSSAYDLMVLARTALENPIFASMVATKATSLDGWSFMNTNELLGEYPGVDGVKTGTSDEAGQCLVVSATRHGHRVIAVVLGATDRYADARALLDYYYTHYVWHALDLPANRFSALEPDEHGRRRYLMPAESQDVLLAHWELPWLRFTIARDQSKARFSAGGRVLKEIPLIVKVL